MKTKLALFSVVILIAAYVVLQGAVLYEQDRAMRQDLEECRRR